MTGRLVSQRMLAVAEAMAPLRTFLRSSDYAPRMGDPDICDFTFGNPHEMPPVGFVEALQRWAEPRDKNWFAYKQNDRHARAVVARNLSARHGLAFEPEDIAMTTGAFGAIAAALALTLDPGDEVVYSLPPWFGYAPMIRHAGGVPVTVRARPDTFDLDLDAIAATLGPRTRMVIVNTPNNPTGRVYPPDDLARLGEILTAASQRFGRPILLLADEPYSRLVFEGKAFHSPAAHYPYTLISYSYGKVLLTPGQRIGYLALAPALPGREALRQPLTDAQAAGGWLFPNALLQHAIEDLETLSVDLDALQAKRDRLVAGLRAIGYRVHVPDGTFYLLPRCPIDDDLAFTRLLARHNVFVMPGTICQIPGHLRICFTATMRMIEDALPGFEAAFREARG
jgi:aspartate aminotransferase